MRKKGFTLVELLVVIAIIAMLLAILMPALGKVRQIAYRMMCGTNLSGIGKAMMIYSNDYDDEFPVAGDASSTWLDTTGGGNDQIGWDWQDPDDTPTGEATISSSLFLLIKYADVSAKQFVCQASDQKTFEVDTSAVGTQNDDVTLADDITECWDFGTMIDSVGTWDFCSYSYQMPYGDYSPSASSPAGLALAADRNPMLDKTANKDNFDGNTNEGLDPFFSFSDDDIATNSKMKQGNSQAHQGEGQEVVYGDIHVSFEKTPNSGSQEDNIYTIWSTTSSPTISDKQLGEDTRLVSPGDDGATDDSQTSDDSFLVNDGETL